MSASTGLMRLGAVLKFLGYAFALLAAVTAFANQKEGYLIGLVFLLPAAGFWAAGWVVQGFAR